MSKELFNKILKESPAYISEFTDMSLEIIDEIHHVLEANNITQKELASRLGKKESEVSKILSSGHNLTLKTIAKLRVALGEKLITVNKSSIKQIDCFKAHAGNKIDEFGVTEVKFLVYARSEAMTKHGSYRQYTKSRKSISPKVSILKSCELLSDEKLQYYGS